MKEFIIDGKNFKTLADAAAEFTRVLNLRPGWSGNLDALDDYLYGGMGTSDEGFRLVWRNSSLSRDRLGYDGTVRWYEDQLRACHPNNIVVMQKGLEDARDSCGPTLFDWIVQIIRRHANIELSLE